MAATKQDNPATKVKTTEVRLSFVQIFTPKAMEGEPESKAKYSVQAIWSKSDTKLTACIEAAIAAATELGKQGTGKMSWGGKVPVNLKTPIRDGDTDPSKGGQAELVGNYFMSCSSKIKPGIIDENSLPVTDESKIYSGCYGRLLLNFYPFNNKSKGVACGLNHVQFLRDGEALSGRGDAAAEFADEDEEGLDS